MGLDASHAAGKSTATRIYLALPYLPRTHSPGPSQASLRVLLQVAYQPTPSLFSRN